MFSYSQFFPLQNIQYCIVLLLPLTAPESYNDLKDMLRGHTSDNQRLIVARTQKSNHPSLAVGNKLKLQVQLQSWMHMCDESAAFTVM